MYRELSGLRVERETLDAHHVTDVEKLLEYGVVHGLVLTWADFITFHVNLYPSRGILKFHERRRSHDSPGHDPTCNAYVLEIAFLRIIFSLNDFRCRVHRVQCCRIRFDSQLPEFVEGLSSDEFLLAQFQICHIFVNLFVQ